jgi:hypothetical protein
MASMGDKRMHNRTNIMARAQALWVDSAGMLHEAPAMLEDTSPSGASMRLKESIGVGSKVRIKWRRGQFLGIVRHVKRQESDYMVGIERDEGVTL